MKKYLNNKFLMIPAIFLLVLTALITNSCKKEVAGDPEIFYVRVTDPDRSDSLLIGAYMGNLVAIIGQNLGDTREIWFNDQKATVSPTYITNTTIIVGVPSSVPTVVTDQLKLVFGNGDELLYDFKVNVPGPQLTGIKCEYVPTGEEAVLTGDYFFNPKVIFPGGIEGTISTYDKTFINVVVPEGTGPGPITVQTTFGKVNSKFIFRDNTNILLDFDTWIHETWTAPIADPASSPSPAPCDGGYAYFKHAAVGEWMWTNEMTMQYWAPRNSRGNVPVAKGQPSDLIFRFEVNVPIEWKDVRMEIFFGPYEENHGRDMAGNALVRWKPWKDGAYKTDGWETISIPLTEFKFNKDDGTSDEIGSATLPDLSKLTNLTMMIFGPFEAGSTDKSPVHICIDNVRIVSK